MLKLCWSNYFPLIIPFVVLSGPQVGKAQQQLPVEAFSQRTSAEKEDSCTEDRNNIWERD